jgi:hypothetical protein
MPRIKGLTGDERWKFKPDVSVNIWELSPGSFECEYWGDAEVSELDEEWLEIVNENRESYEHLDWDDIGLEPCDEYGNPIKLMDAYTDEWISLIPYQNRLS